VKSKIIISIVAVIIGIVALVLWGQKTHAVDIVSPKEVFDRAQRDSNVVLIDVRTEEEYNGDLGHVAGTILIPVQQLDQRANELDKYKDRIIIAICRSGNRSGKAAELLSHRGFTALNMEGGMLQWNRDKLPVIRDTTR